MLKNHYYDYLFLKDCRNQFFKKFILFKINTIKTFFNKFTINYKNTFLINNKYSYYNYYYNNFYNINNY